jgi:hypothetical protein
VSASTISIYTDHRRAIRYAFGGVAEATVKHSGEYLMGPASEISRHGYLLKTNTASTAGTHIQLRITHDGKEFVAAATVVYFVPGRDPNPTRRMFSPNG